jgi:hypothetical protein
MLVPEDKEQKPYVAIIKVYFFPYQVFIALID